jgi:hypothetical protein
MVDGNNIGADSWSEWRRHVLLEAESQRKTLERIETQMSDLKTDIALLKYKSSLFGALGAGVVVLIYALAQGLMKT